MNDRTRDTQRLGKTLRNFQSYLLLFEAQMLRSDRRKLRMLLVQLSLLLLELIRQAGLPVVL